MTINLLQNSLTLPKASKFSTISGESFKIWKSNFCTAPIFAKLSAHLLAFLEIFQCIISEGPRQIPAIR